MWGIFVSIKLNNRLRLLSTKQVCQILADYGFEQVGQHGSHIIATDDGVFKIEKNVD